MDSEPTPHRTQPVTPGQINAVQGIVASEIDPTVTGTAPQMQLTDLITRAVRDALTAAAVVLSIVHNRPIGTRERRELERLAIARYDLTLIEIITSPDKYSFELRTLATASYTSKPSRDRVRAGLIQMAASYVGTQPNPATL